MKARNRMLWRDLWHLRGQVIAAALVVACGVAAFLSMRATYESLLQARDDYYHALRFADVFVQLKRAPLSLAARIAEIPGVAQVRTRVVLHVTLDVPGLDEPASGRLVSIPEQPRPMLNDLSLRAGRYVEPGRDDEVIASEAFAAANGLKVGDGIGAVINGRWKRLRIVGVALSPEYIYEVGAGTIFPDNRRFGVLWMGEKALASAFDMDGAFNDVSLALAAGASEADVIERLDLLLARYGGLGAYGREEQLSHRFISDEIAQNRITSTFVPGIFLGVAAFLLHIVLSRLTAMQRTQIGLLKAFGYSNREVGLHYLKLALVTVLAGLALGSALGVYAGSWLTDLYRDYYRFPRLAFEVSPRVLSLTLLIALAAAVIGALGAVRRAVRLPPAEAMRPEPPATFHAGLLERTGLSARLPSSARMIARSIARRRWKSLLAVLGIGCAVGILVLGRFGLDAMNYMMHVQFEVVQRDDVMVIFTEPESAGVRHELERLPGVLTAEPFRTVPVRLRFEHRTKRVELTGLPPDGELRRLVDAKLRPVRLPASGVVLTRKLGELLGVRPGELIIRVGARRRTAGAHPPGRRAGGRAGRHRRVHGPARAQRPDARGGLALGRLPRCGPASRPGAVPGTQAAARGERGCVPRRGAAELQPDPRSQHAHRERDQRAFRLRDRLRRRLQRRAHRAVRARQRAGLAAGAGLHPPGSHLAVAGRAGRAHAAGRAAGLRARHLDRLAALPAA